MHILNLTFGYLLQKCQTCIYPVIFTVFLLSLTYKYYKIFPIVQSSFYSLAIWTRKFVKLKVNENYKIQIIGSNLKYYTLYY